MNIPLSSSPHSADHWPDLATQWAQVGSPLRPVEADVALFTQAVVRCAAERDRPLRALILGVTPELYRLPWPAGTRLLAVDHTQAMIDNVWPGQTSEVACGQWTHLPLATGSRDIVVCDGGVHLISHPAEHWELVEELHRVIAPGGYFVARLFVPPAQRQSPAAVLESLLAGEIANLNILKLQLGMALQQSAADGVELATIWETLHNAAGDFPTLAARLGWPLAHLLAINTYRNCPRRYHFVTTEEVRALFCRHPGGFEIEIIPGPNYPMGEQCPIVVAKRAKKRKVHSAKCKVETDT
jgi:SAM-dependent methyltransferase